MGFLRCLVKVEKCFEGICGFGSKSRKQSSGEQIDGMEAVKMEGEGGVLVWRSEGGVYNGEKHSY